MPAPDKETKFGVWTLTHSTVARLKRRATDPEYDAWLTANSYYTEDKPHEQ
jgi:hypothetical protein